MHWSEKWDMLQDKYKNQKNGHSSSIYCNLLNNNLLLITTDELSFLPMAESDALTGKITN
jgi:hypothetical protein